MTIKTLFDPTKDIYRTIEKVITYGASQEARLKAEIAEYIVTESIDDQLEKLLSAMQTAMDQGGESEVGVWVSGFYGSGKSSFTKYLALALDDHVIVDGITFREHLQNRLLKATTRSLLSKVAKGFPGAVILLDLASEMLAGATMEDVSTVLYYKVLQWAGYSRNLKVAAFERKLQKDGRYDEFTARIQTEVGTTWKQVQNDPLVIDSLIPDIAHQMYPDLFKSPASFSTETGDFIRFENERVQEMIDIVRQVSGRQYIIFVVDEVGQYVGGRPNLILNLQGFAQNLKQIGDGKVWLVGTAQQTLTEDDPRAALNSPELYKLKDRFPIQIDLESSDIKEICYRRLLAKSADGQRELGDRFDKDGQALRHNTKLHDAKYYDADFDKTTFANLYPFLPAHFDILLHLLGSLAKSTGGIGLRSAIKIIQDILVEGPDDRTPVADQPVGWLATTVTLYDALEKDIRRAFPSIHKAVGKVLIRFVDSLIHQEVAKTVAVLQILGNMPVTAQNVTSLMHAAVDAPSRRDQVDTAIADLTNDALVPFGEKDGNLCFFSEKLNDIDQERAQLPVRSIEARRIFNEALREAFSPLPSTRVHGTLAVTSGLKAVSGSLVSSLAGERETVQTLVELVDPSDYETARVRLIDESRERSSLHVVYLLGRTASQIDEKVAEIYRCRETDKRYHNDPDQEVKDYCSGLLDRAAKLTGELRHAIKASLAQGSFVFRGQATAAATLDADLLKAAQAYLADVAGQVFDRYGEAAVRADTTLAEKFLRTGNLKAVTSTVDPLGLVQIQGGVPRIRTDHKALLSIRDLLDKQGTVEGRRLLDTFSDAPFGWSQDTLRYLIAALLVAGEIKLKVSGREVTVNGQQAVDALRTNNAFKAIGVALRDERVPPEVLARAAERLTDLIGDTVIPLEDEISKATAKYLPQCQHRFGPLAERLATLGLPGADNVRSLNQEIADVLLTDASDAPQRLGAEQSPLYDQLKWAGQIEVALKQGLEGTVREIQRHRRDIESMPRSGVPGRLYQDVEEELQFVSDRLSQYDFGKHAADLNTTLTTLQARSRDASIQMEAAQKDTVREAQQDLQRLAEWPELTQEEQSQTLGQLDDLVIQGTPDLRGLKQLLGQEYVIGSRVSELKKHIEQLGRERRLQRLKDEKAQAEQTGQTKGSRSLSIPAAVTSAGQLESLIQQLQKIKDELAVYSEIEITIKLEG